MPAGLNTAAVVNSALEQIAAQTQITSLGDGSPAANAAAVVYPLTVQLLLRQLEPDFARITAALAASTGAPSAPWAFAYTYPADCARLLQVAPASAVRDPNDPQPVRASVGFILIAAVPAKVILTNQTAALAAYISSTVTEVQWDPAFTEAVVRRLANPLAMAISGRLDFAREVLSEAIRVAEVADSVDDSMVSR